MHIYPAIDIRGGKCVRLIQGDFDKEILYNDDPVAAAIDFCVKGAEYLHIVDLDGAKTGSGVNDTKIKKIIETTGVRVQTGGGIRTAEDIEKRFLLGVNRVILGTIAVTNPDFVKEQVKKHGERILVGIDALDGYTKIAGWSEKSSITALSHALKMQEMGVKTIVYTDISKDCMMSGPNIPDILELMEKTNLRIIASGGVGTHEHLYELEKTGVYGCIVGNALYTGDVKIFNSSQLHRMV